ncbi:D-tagatose-bisphosphate aldolase, class II, non-catalytic subunit [Pseudonocardia xinjiangensis]|uniref:D-tagatose-bisphosphate aldolase, class II, non-catalytic subunit n=1 Tax=Pseudonocardia xinjiangensis TaxID=75289 RepID=A0ABX1RJ79_9PSEU|nr:D-tagatose-bisphosphate aldolase, class II, non-catalytic subunit [Pseudonocardia xinjiangensis]NMH79283.1 D-tagatose-bisphosphate aldolase, class II, non-catalytic subunit [Pseudonocardia xinjiangensis]
MFEPPTPGSSQPAQVLRDRLIRNRAGEPVGVTSVCSAHPLVIEAAAMQAVDDGGLLLVEATSNQVDQYGGYTGMRPADFAALVHRTAERVALPLDRVVLGGDHLGPNRWRDLGPDEAMERAEALVAAYVRAGYVKIHLDCSMACAGDPVPLPGVLVAERAARLARVAEKAAGERENPVDLVYVIGTEVPVPGGAQETIDALAPTTPESARATVAEHQAAFTEAGAATAWEQVIALVVQPGVEFDHVRVVDYERAAARQLSSAIAEFPGLVFEAHSTDYQTRTALADLVRDSWAVLKVGPGLTFALREALFGLAAIEDELVAEADRSDLGTALEAAMLTDPTWWTGYYEGDPDQQRLARRYSYSDRSRYYWPDPAVALAVERLFRNLDMTGIPMPMLSQYLPEQYRRVRLGELPAQARALVIDHVRDVLRDYAYACGQEEASA